MLGVQKHQRRARTLTSADEMNPPAFHKVWINITVYLQYLGFRITPQRAAIRKIAANNPAITSIKYDSLPVPPFGA